MINIDPYIERLEALKEYMSECVDLGILGCYLRFDDKVSVIRTRFRISDHPASFSEWYNMKKSQPETDKP